MGIGYLILIVGYILVFAGVLIQETNPSVGEYILIAGSILSFLSLIPLIFGAVIWFVFIYRIWTFLPEKFRRTTPGKAVGFMFIPFFNYYWIFQAIWGFSKDYNRFVLQNRPDAPRLQEGLFLTYPILTLASIPLSLIPGINLFVYIGIFVIGLIIINASCNAVNYLADK